MWQTKNKVADASIATKSSDVQAPAAAVDTRRSKRNKSRRAGKKAAAAADRQLRKFFQGLGSSLESLIDASPLGVTTPCEPWNPTTDKKKALLSNPMEVALDAVSSDALDALSPASNFLSSAGETASGWVGASSAMLLSLREGLENAALAEQALDKDGTLKKAEDVDAPPVMIEIEDDVTVPGEDDDEEESSPFVDLGADKWGNSARTARPAGETVSEVRAMKKAVSRFLNKRALPLLDSLTLRANGIVVTSDDASVECSLASLIRDDEFEACSLSSDDGSFEECPSVITEVDVQEDLELEEDEEEEDTEVEDDIEVLEVTKVEGQEGEESQEDAEEVSICTEGADEDEGFVLAEEPESDDDDFVDLGADEFDVARSL